MPENLFKKHIIHHTSILVKVHLLPQLEAEAQEVHLLTEEEERPLDIPLPKIN